MWRNGSRPTYVVAHSVVENSNGEHSCDRTAPSAPLRAGLGGCPYIIFRKELERETGIEPATSSLGSWRSTAELLPLNFILLDRLSSTVFRLTSVRLPLRFIQDNAAAVAFISHSTYHSRSDLRP